MGRELSASGLHAGVRVRASSSPGLEPGPPSSSSALGLAVEVKVPTEPLSTPVGKTAELVCSYSTSVGSNFALEWSFVQPGKPISASHPVSVTVCRGRVGQE